MRSTKGIKIDSAVAQEGGLQWNKVGDRTFRLIDAKNGVTLGCKLIPKLLKINLEIANDIIHFTITGLFKLLSSLIFTEQSTEEATLQFLTGRAPHRRGRLPVKSQIIAIF